MSKASFCPSSLYFFVFFVRFVVQVFALRSLCSLGGVTADEKKARRSGLFTVRPQAPSWRISVSTAACRSRIAAEGWPSRLTPTQAAQARRKPGTIS